MPPGKKKVFCAGCRASTSMPLSNTKGDSSGSFPASFFSSSVGCYCSCYWAFSTGTGATVLMKFSIDGTTQIWSSSAASSSARPLESKSIDLSDSSSLGTHWDLDLFLFLFSFSKICFSRAEKIFSTFSSGCYSYSCYASWTSVWSTVSTINFFLISLNYFSYNFLIILI